MLLTKMFTHFHVAILVSVKVLNVSYYSECNLQDLCWSCHYDSIEHYFLQGIHYGVYYVRMLFILDF